MNPIQHIQLHEDEFTKAEKKIMAYVIDHFDIISSYPISDVASKCGVSKSALLRFCQKCGYQGYSEFKYEISRFIQSMTSIDEDPDHVRETMVTLYIDQICNLLRPEITEGFHELSKLITTARKIKIYGIHETVLSCQYFAYRLATLGIDAEAITSGHTIAEKASFSSKEDLNIFISLSAKTTSIVDGIKYAQKKGAMNVLITQNNHHTFKNITKSIILPTFNYEQKKIFLDAQALVHIAIDLLINDLATFS